MKRPRNWWPDGVCVWCLNTGRATFNHAEGEIECPPCTRGLAE
jgi:ribosomal protein S27E